MKQRRFILLITLLTIISCFAVLSVKADIYDEIAAALKAGNSKEIAKYFSARVELKIAETENIYSKPQAEIILKDFFSKNPPISFSIRHRGASSKGLPYMIGDLLTSNGSFRTYILFKQEGSQFFIQELSFEKE